MFLAPAILQIVSIYLFCEPLHPKKKEIHFTKSDTPGQKPNFSIQSIELIALLASSFCRNRTRVILMLWVSKEVIYMGIIGVFLLLQSCCHYRTSQDKLEQRAKTPLLANGAWKSHSLISTSHYYCCHLQGKQRATGGCGCLPHVL